MSGKRDCQARSGADARKRLNDLGYSLDNEKLDPFHVRMHMVTLGLIVAMAEEIELLRTELWRVKTANNRGEDLP